MAFKILAIDGGGVGGIYSARYMQEIAARLDRPIREYFDLICGTSTGGILAIGIGLGLAPEKLVELYRLHGKTIFGRPRWWGRMLNDSKHDPEFLRKILQQVFGESRLGDARPALCIPSVDLKTHQIRVFKTDHSPNFYKDCNRTAWEVALATTAAPLYFPPAATSDGIELLVDGGLWANNPSLVGVLEASRVFARNHQDISLLSIGTGRTLFKRNNGRGWGFLRWFKNNYLLRLFLEAQGQAVERMVEYYGSGQYLRVNDILPDTIDLDDWSKMPELEAFAVRRAQATCQDVHDRFFNETAMPRCRHHYKIKEEVI